MLNFEPNEAIDCERERLNADYNANWERLKASIKGSLEHRECLRMENRLNNATRKFLSAHSHYYTLKRKHYILKGVMNRPQVLPMDEQEKEYFNDRLSK